MLFTAFVFLIVINLQPKFVCLVSGEAQWAATPGLAGSSHLGRFRCPASGWRWVPRNLVTENCADEEDVKIFISSMQIWIAMFSNSSCPLESMASLRRRRWCVGGCCKTGQSFARAFANQSSHLSKEGPGEATIVTIVKLHTRAKAFELKYTVLVKLFKKSIPTAPTWTPQMLLDSVFSGSSSAFLFDFEFMEAIAATRGLCTEVSFKTARFCCEAYIESQSVTRQGPMMVVEDRWRRVWLQDTNRWTKGSERTLSGCVALFPFLFESGWTFNAWFNHSLEMFGEDDGYELWLLW